MAKYENQSFTDQSLVLDGNEYIGCRFQRCELIFTGATLPILRGNDIGFCKWTLDGPAGRTIQFMVSLYVGGGKDIVEATFDLIRGKPVKGPTLN